MNVPEGMQYLLDQLRPYGIRGTITSGVRSYQQQAQLYANRSTNPNPVARPGSSKHELGLAVDISASEEAHQVISRIWKSWGGTWGGDWRKPDKVHYEF